MTEIADAVVESLIEWSERRAYPPKSFPLAETVLDWMQGMDEEEVRECVAKGWDAVYAEAQAMRA